MHIFILLTFLFKPGLANANESSSQSSNKKCKVVFKHCLSLECYPKMWIKVLKNKACLLEVKRSWEKLIDLVGNVSEELWFYLLSSIKQLHDKTTKSNGDKIVNNLSGFGIFFQ